MHPRESVAIEQSPLHRAATLLLASEGPGGEIRLAGDDHTDAPVCVCIVVPSSGTRRAALVSAVARTRSIHRLTARPPAGYRVIDAQVVLAGELRSTRRGRFSAWVRAGAIVELHRDVAHRRVLDEVFEVAGRRGPYRIGSAGEIVADLGPHVLRIQDATQPHVNALALRSLAGRIQTPRVIASGTVAGAAWSIETRVSGRRPRTLSRQLAHDAAAFCSCLPRSESAATAPFDDIAELRSRFPEYMHVWNNSTRALHEGIPARSIARHGDLWIGNLLAVRGRLTGVVDWDAWHPAGVPGADLLHLHAFDPSVSLGRRVLQRPWRTEPYSELTDAYWKALDVRVTPPLLDAVGMAWWVGQLAAALRRDPELAKDEQWVETNVVSAAAAFA